MEEREIKKINVRGILEKQKHKKETNFIILFFCRTRKEKMYHLHHTNVQRRLLED